MHTCVLASQSFWDPYIKNLIIPPSNLGYFISDNDPSGTPYNIPRTRWAQRLALFTSTTPRTLKSRYSGSGGYANLVSDILTPLSSPTGPYLVILDECANGSEDVIAAAASYINAVYPGVYTNRWGVYLVNGPAVDYYNLDGGTVYPHDPISECLRAGARILPEFYARYSDYCSNGHDPWLEAFFLGGTNSYGIAVNRLAWLVNRWVALGSASRIHPIFGVTDEAPIDFLAGGDPKVFLDRMFYVFVHYTYPGFLYDTNDGGVGTWKWDSNGVSTTTRQSYFQGSYNHYCKSPYSTSSLRGTVPC